MVLGCGEIGSRVVKSLIKYSDAEVIAADIDIDKAERLITVYGSDRLCTKTIDINDHDSMVKTIKVVKPDVVASTVGPFYLNAGKVYKGCIDAKVNCVDICDDIEGAKEALALHDKAKMAGVTIITGLGDSPGLTNIVVKYCAGRMESVEDVNIFWVAPFSNIGVAQYEHAIYCFMYPHQYISGKLIPMSGRVKVEFPSPIGEIELLYSDHPEPYTIPRYIKEVKNVRCAGGTWPPLPKELIDSLPVLEPVLMQPLGIRGMKIMPMEFFAHMLVRLVDYWKKGWESKGIDCSIGGTIIEVKGRKDGKATKLVFSAIGRGMSATARTLSTVAKMVARGDIKVKGVYAPEGCIEPESFMKELSGGFLTFKISPEKNYYCVDIVETN